MYILHILYILVGGIPTPLKNMKVNWDDDIPNIWKNKTCSKPPTRYRYKAFHKIDGATKKQHG